MNQSKRCFSFLLLLFLTAVLLTGASAQADSNQAEPSYEVSIQVVVGSNGGGPGVALPSNLGGIAKQLKSNFSFENYRLTNTIFGRVSNNGNIEYKSVSDIGGQDIELNSQTFLEWSLTNFRVVPNGFHARGFRFGARVPVRTGTTKDETGRPLPIINYESIGLTVNMIGFPANKPTLVGTISLPKTSGTIFLVATVRTAEM